MCGKICVLGARLVKWLLPFEMRLPSSWIPFSLRGDIEDSTYCRMHILSRVKVREYHLLTLAFVISKLPI